MSQGWGPGPTPMTVPSPDFGSILTFGWNAFVRNFWILVACVLLSSIIQVPGSIVSQIGAFIGMKSPAAGIAVQILGMIVSYALAIPAQYGVLRVSAEAVRGFKPDIASFFRPFTNFQLLLNCWGHAILSGLVALVVLAPAIALTVVGFVTSGIVTAAQQGGQPPPSAAFLLLGWMGAAFVAAIPGLWVMIRLMLGGFFVAEQLAGPLEAIPLSWQISRGHAATIVLLILTAFVLVIVGFLLCCVGIIPATALYMVYLAALHAALTPSAPVASASQRI